MRVAGALAFAASVPMTMRIPVLRGIIDRRILVNWRVDPDVLARRLPAPFRPNLYRGHALAGICLIRLRAVRPRGVPAWLGIASENAAHRAAVEWDEDGRVREGVFIWRRDTGSWLNSLAGGRVFPGEHHRATFRVHETAQHFEVGATARDDGMDLAVVADLATELPPASVFPSVGDASAFFATGACGWSVTGDAGRFDGLELRCERWEVEPLAVRSVRSSVFDDRAAFPADSIELDNALLMRGIGHTWHGLPDLHCVGSAG
jgi:hypothetical protein